MSQKVLENTNEICSCPCASYNTPSIELIQYGHHIGKKVYLVTLVTQVTQVTLIRVT